MIDLKLTNVRLLDAHAGEIRDASIAVREGRVVAIDEGFAAAARETVDGEGLIAAPGLVDAHMHVDTTFLAPGELTRAIVPLGTTTIIVDNTNNAHAWGVGSVAAMLGAFKGLPLRAFMIAPSYCPLDTAIETAAEDLAPGCIASKMLPDALGIGETVWSRIAAEDRGYIELIQHTRACGKRPSGHGGEIARGDTAAFDAYTAAGIADDHCIGRAVDIADRLRRGLQLFLAECSGRHGQLRPLLDAMIAGSLPLRRTSLCRDNLTLMDMIGAGHGYQNQLIDIARGSGISLIDAVRMASLQPAEHYRLAGTIGSLGVGRCADILLIDEHGPFAPRKVYSAGALVAENGRLVLTLPPSPFAATLRTTVAVPPDIADRLSVHVDPAAGRALVHVIAVRDGDAFNDATTAMLPVDDGKIGPDLASDTLLIAALERYGRQGGVGTGFVRGIGLRRGAVASSASIPSNNIVAVGTNTPDMMAAIAHVARLQGGFAVVADGTVLADVPLPIGGILGELPYEELLDRIEQAQSAMRELGSRLRHPLFTIMQTGLSTLPDFGLTDRGLINVRTSAIVSPVLDLHP
jgi:adenine deaminase